MGKIQERLNQKKILLSDGAWGTFLFQKGLEAGDCPELWNAEHPDDVLDIAKSYVKAGADIILTNSFGGNPHKLKHYGLEERAFELNFKAAEISRQAAGGQCLVLGSMGPSGAILMMGEVSPEELYQGFLIQAEALAKGGVDAICVETMSALDEAELAVKAAKEASGLEVVCTFTFEKGASGQYNTMMGVTPLQMTQAMIACGADIIGTNCGNGFDQMVDIVKKIREANQSIPVLAHANAGLPKMVNGETVFPETAEIMASKVHKMLQAGANIIGGCCGTTPEHIRLMAAEIAKYT
ncbi:MAG: homocysteine S-methyltransferase family protein [Spirochaetales bacterium]|nr:homocysteine S-methyltransferase family protein [Spirochaetales bacterium]